MRHPAPPAPTTHVHVHAHYPPSYAMSASLDLRTHWPESPHWPERSASGLKLRTNVADQHLPLPLPQPSPSATGSTPVGGFTSSMGPVSPERTPTRDRATGLGLGYVASGSNETGRCKQRHLTRNTPPRRPRCPFVIAPVSCSLPHYSAPISIHVTDPCQRRFNVLAAAWIGSNTPAAHPSPFPKCL